jgi:phosphoribosylformimino-5-aminoimidazole carboxamide ribonucleotide (ProFAR) isomerase
VQLYPAIDVQGGQVARADGAAPPQAAARALAAAGAAWAHVVDLDRALGTGRNDRTMREVIAELAAVRVQLGGGLTEPDEVREALEWGVERVVVGEGAVSRLDELVRLAGSHKLGVAVGPHPLTPTPFGRRGTRGERKSPLSGTERGTGGEADGLARAVESGITTVVYRDRDRDGTLSGANLEGAARLLGRGADIILAGGIATLDELRRARDAGFAGVIVGRALLTGRFTLHEALQCCG